MERNNRTMGKHHTRVKMLASSKCSVRGHDPQGLGLSPPGMLGFEIGVDASSHPYLVLPYLSAQLLSSCIGLLLLMNPPDKPLSPPPPTTGIGKPGPLPVLGTRPGHSWLGLWKILSRTLFTPSWGS